MPRFAIRRELPGATEAEVDAAALRAIACIAEMNNRVTWVRSYWDQRAESILCVYDAPNEQLIREHADIALIPCDEVREVSEIGPTDYLDRIEPNADLASVPQ